MLQLILFGLVKVLQRFIVWLIAFPVLLIISTPIILVRALILAARKRQRFRYAVTDGYDYLCSLWTPLGTSRGI